MSDIPKCTYLHQVKLIWIILHIVNYYNIINKLFVIVINNYNYYYYLIMLSIH